MNSNQISLLDLTKKEDLLKAFPHNLFTRVYQTGLIGKGLLHTCYLPGENNEHSFQQHSIIVHLKTEQNSRRCLGGTVEVENVNIGDITIVPAEIKHWQKIEAEVTENLIVTIEPQTISYLAYEIVKPENLELMPTFAQSDPLIQHITLNLKANLDSPNYDKLYAESLFHLLLMHLVKNYASKRKVLQNYCHGLPPHKLKQAREYIKANIDCPIKLSDIADLLDISQYYFCHLFKKSTGIAPYQYIIQQRVEKAKGLIRHNQMSLSEIAYECGFSSQSQMTHHFRKHIGITPKVYQNS